MRRRLYSLFERDGKRWKRVSDLALTKQSAIVTFQGRLLARSFIGSESHLPELRLRPLSDAQLRADEERINSLVVKAEAIVEGS